MQQVIFWTNRTPVGTFFVCQFLYFVLCRVCDRLWHSPSCRIPSSRFPSHFHYCNSLSLGRIAPRRAPSRFVISHEWREWSDHLFICHVDPLCLHTWALLSSAEINPPQTALMQRKWNALPDWNYAKIRWNVYFLIFCFCSFAKRFLGKNRALDFLKSWLTCTIWSFYFEKKKHPQIEKVPHIHHNCRFSTMPQRSVGPHAIKCSCIEEPTPLMEMYCSSVNNAISKEWS